MPLRLEDLTPDAQVTGLIGREAVRIVSAQLLGEACEVVYQDPRFQERCHPFEPSIRGLEDMTNAPIMRGCLAKGFCEAVG